MNRIVANCAAFSSRSLLSSITAKASRSPTFWNEVRFVFKPIQYALHQMKQLARHQCSYAPINLQLQRLEKDVIVYKYNNPKYYKILNIFGLLQFVFLAGTAEFEFTQLIDLPVNEDASSNKDLPWYQRINLGSNKMRYTMAFICGLAGQCSVKAQSRIEPLPTHKPLLHRCCNSWNRLDVHDEKCALFNSSQGRQYNQCGDVWANRQKPHSHRSTEVCERR